MTISTELLDELLSGVERPEDFFRGEGPMKELKVRLMERELCPKVGDGVIRQHLDVA